MTTASPLDAFRAVAEGYNDTPNALLTLDRRTLPQLMPELQGKIVIDVAAGTGYWASWCTARGARAIALDFCEAMLRQAKTACVLGDSLRLPFASGSADVTICSFGLGYSPACFSELARITKPGGVVIASDMHPRAIERGWRRTFRNPEDGSVVEVEHAHYQIGDLHAPHLEREALLEPCFGYAERAIFEQMGKLAKFDAAAQFPAIFAARWRRV